MAKKTRQSKRIHDEGPSWFAAIAEYIQYAILLSFGHIRDFFGNLSGKSRYLAKKPRKGYASMLVSWEHFYTKRVYHRIQDVFNRPVASAPGAHIDVYERYSDDGNKTLHIQEGKLRHCLNLGSYNYLGFADDWMSTCSNMVLPQVQKYSCASSTSAVEYGMTPLHQELEEMVAEYLGKPAAMIYNMGYGTNSFTIPALCDKGTLIISDQLNHASIVNGARGSKATVRVFRHNQPEDLERVLRHGIAYGQPRTHRPWKKILVIIEGIYSMEGEIANLPALVNICKKYKAYIYVDEAHSIGALGKTGRGVCEYHNVDTKDIDVLMGTFTKSFAGMGGYIAGSKEMIDHLRRTSGGSIYGTTLSPIVTAQVLASFKVILGRDGTNIGANKLKALRENSNYFRKRLMDIGGVTLGDEDSPVIPVMLYGPTKIAAFSRECFKRNLAVVAVGFPATPLLLARVRFCISAAHTIDDLEKALVDIAEISKLCHIRFEKYTFG